MKLPGSLKMMSEYYSAFLRAARVVAAAVRIQTYDICSEVYSISMVNLYEGRYKSRYLFSGIHPVAAIFCSCMQMLARLFTRAK